MHPGGGSAGVEAALVPRRGSAEAGWGEGCPAAGVRVAPPWSACLRLIDTIDAAGTWQARGQHANALDELHDAFISLACSLICRRRLKKARP